MPQIFNIELGDDFFRQAARIINDGFSDHVVVVPNHRSVQELKKELLRDNGNIIIPKIISLSDYVKIDEDLVVFKVFGVLRCTYAELPSSALFDLAYSICDLVKDFIFNDVHCQFLREKLPSQFAEHWKITESILMDVFCDETIKHVVDFSIDKNASFLDGLDKVLVVGIDASCCWGKRLVCKALLSGPGGVIFCGMERECVNRSVFCDVVKNKGEVIYVPRETLGGIVEEISCSCREEECFAVCVAVRKYVDDQEDVLIVCPEQSLSCQIRSQLLRWNIVTDSSVGDDFWHTCAGLLMRCALKVVECNYDVESVICLLKLKQNLQNDVSLMEAFLRKQRFVRGVFFDEVDGILNELSLECQKIVEELKKNEVLNGERSFLAWFDVCVRVVECVDPGCVEEIKTTARGVLRNARFLPLMNCSDFVGLLVKSLFSKMVKRREKCSGKVRVVNAVEAQLLHSDRVIIVEANEASWSASGKENSLLGAGVRKEFGLSDGESVNMFLQCVFERLFFKPNVLVTRALRVEGTPQIPYVVYKRLSRFRLVKQADWLSHILIGVRKSLPRESIKFTPPSPSLKDRPAKMYATDIESLLNNPYVFYAKRILRLSKLPYINDCENMRGKYIHEILHDFVAKHHNNMSLEEVALACLQKNCLSPVDFGVWYFRMNKIFKFVEKNMPFLSKMFCEIEGGAFISLGGDERVKIACRADRLDVSCAGKITIVDYKTGTVPTKSSIVNGVKPQLLVEAFIGKNQGFFQDKGDVANLCFWKLDGKQEGGSVVCIANDADEVGRLVDDFSDKLRGELIKYNVNGDAYEYNVNASYDEEYKHLARVKEWTGA